jgi:hypothetical protein
MRCVIVDIPIGTVPAPLATLNSVMFMSALVLIPTSTAWTHGDSTGTPWGDETTFLKTSCAAINIRMPPKTPYIAT